MIRTLKRSAAMLAAIGFLPIAAGALPIKEFRKFSQSDQANYIMAAVSMLAYTYAANGDMPKGRCIQNWFFGQKGTPTPGPNELATRIAAYESLDAEKYHVEGVILGVTDKVCGTAPQTKQR